MEECSFDIRNTCGALYKWKQSQKKDDKTKYNEETAIVKRVVEENNQERWEEFCDNINIQTSVKEGWDKIKGLKNAK